MTRVSLSYRGYVLIAEAVSEGNLWAVSARCANGEVGLKLGWVERVNEHGFVISSTRETWPTLEAGIMALFDSKVMPVS